LAGSDNARKYQVLPLERAGARLTLAMADPTDVSALDDVEFMTNLKVLPVVAAPGVIRQAVERLAEAGGAALAGAVTEAGRSLDSDAEVVRGEEESWSKVDAFELKESVDEPPVVRLINMLLADAIRRGASDVHFEPYEKVFRVRFRADGVLHEIMTPPKRLDAALTSRMKIMASLDIAERRLPQDGRIKLRYQAREIDFRISTLPTIFGEKTVMRIHKPQPRDSRCESPADQGSRCSLGGRGGSHARPHWWVACAASHSAKKMVVPAVPAEDARQPGDPRSVICQIRPTVSEV
jgi:type IV pilus assembly protein PilB